MAKVSDATDVTALACNKSDTKPAIMLPTYICMYRKAGKFGREKVW